MIDMGKRLTFEALVSGFALRAGLIALSSFILIARSANRKCTFIASNKWLPIHCYLYLIPTDLANLPTQFFDRCYLQFIGTIDTISVRSKTKIIPKASEEEKEIL